MWICVHHESRVLIRKHILYIKNLIHAFSFWFNCIKNIYNIYCIILKINMLEFLSLWLHMIFFNRKHRGIKNFFFSSYNVLREKKWIFIIQVILYLLIFYILYSTIWFLINFLFKFYNTFFLDILFPIFQLFLKKIKRLKILPMIMLYYAYVHIL